MPRWPRCISWWCVSSVRLVPIDPTSRPDEKLLPSARQMTARTSGSAAMRPNASNSWTSMSSSKALCLSGLSLVRTATWSSMVTCTVPATAGSLLALVETRRSVVV